MLVFRRNREKGLTRITIFLPLIEAFAEPVLRFGRQILVWVFLQEVTKGLLGQTVIFVQYITVSEIVFVLRRVGRR